MKKFFVLGIFLILSLGFFGCSDGGGGGGGGPTFPDEMRGDWNQGAFDLIITARTLQILPNEPVTLQKFDGDKTFELNGPNGPRFTAEIITGGKLFIVALNSTSWFYGGTFDPVP